MPNIELHSSMTSQFFIGNSANLRARFGSSLPGGRYLPRKPFTAPKSGKELGWQGAYSNDEGSGGIYMSLTSYDRELFKGISLIVMAGGCTKPADILWLSSDRDKANAFKKVSLPQSWRLRVKQTLADSDERSKAFFKQQGEQAIKALQAKPAQNKTITPTE